MTDLAKFGKIVKLKAFLPFKNAADALENINDISEGLVNPTLRTFLEMNLPKVSAKKATTTSGHLLGVSDKTLASSIKADLGFDCVADEMVLELTRGLRLFAPKMLKALKEGDMEKAQLGLGHSYSRCKVKFNVNRVDNMIIQAIALLDQLDKDINTFVMRVREWYGWHFPELGRLIPTDHACYARLVLAIPGSDKGRLGEDSLAQLEAACGGDASLARLVVEASKSSMGTECSALDMANIRSFATRLLGLTEYRARLHEYLVEKMDVVAPNLAALIGEIVGARLIAHAGSLTNLSKYPASTVQILGAEKALFRALKTKGNTPKYGLLYHASAIGKAGARNKGRISRYLANKCSIASRIDCFSETPTNKFGQAMRGQVDERLKFFDSGVSPAKNLDVMHSVIAELEKEGLAVTSKKDKSKKDSKKELKKSDKEIEKESKKVSGLKKSEKEDLKSQKEDKKEEPKSKKEEKKVEKEEPKSKKEVKKADKEKKKDNKEDKKDAFKLTEEKPKKQESSIEDKKQSKSNKRPSESPAAESKKSKKKKDN